MGVLNQHHACGNDFDAPDVGNVELVEALREVEGSAEAVVLVDAAIPLPDTTAPVRTVGRAGARPHSCRLLLPLPVNRRR